MSWAELKKINSNFTSEALNHYDYINNIAMFGANSYVMDPSNEKLWRDLLIASSTIYGHRAIHDYVYNRLTSADVDFVVTNHGKLGESLNSFYQTDIFPSGGVDNLLKTITGVKYNTMGLKFQSSINRYIDGKLTATTCGAWLSTTFNAPALASSTSISSIITNSTLWNDTIMPNQSLRMVICNAVSTIGFVAESSITGQQFADFINIISESTPATMELLDRLSDNGKLTNVFTNENFCTTVTSKEASMRGIISHATAFKAMMQSTVATNKVAASQTAIDVIFDGITSSSKCEVVLTNIKTNIDEVKTDYNTLSGISIPVPTNALTNTLASINSTISLVEATNGKIDVLIENIQSFKSSIPLMNAITQSPSAIAAIKGNTNALNAIRSSEMATAKFIMAQAGRSFTEINAVTNITQIGNNGTFMTAVARSDDAMVTLKESSQCMNVLTTLNTAMNILAFEPISKNQLYNSTIGLEMIRSKDMAVAKLAVGHMGFSTNAEVIATTGMSYINSTATLYNTLTSAGGANIPARILVGSILAMTYILTSGNNIYSGINTETDTIILNALKETNMGVTKAIMKLAGITQNTIDSVVSINDLINNSSSLTAILDYISVMPSSVGIELFVSSITGPPKNKEYYSHFYNGSDVMINSPFTQPGVSVFADSTPNYLYETIFSGRHTNVTSIYKLLRDSSLILEKLMLSPVFLDHKFLLSYYHVRQGGGELINEPNWVWNILTNEPMSYPHSSYVRRSCKLNYNKTSIPYAKFGFLNPNTNFIKEAYKSELAISKLLMSIGLYYKHTSTTSNWSGINTLSAAIGRYISDGYGNFNESIKFATESTLLNKYLITNVTQMNTLLGMSSYRGGLRNSTAVMNVIGSTDISSAKYIMGEGGQSTSNASGMTDIVNNDTFLTTIVASSNATYFISAFSRIAFDAFGSSSIALNKVITSSTASNRMNDSLFNDITFRALIAQTLLSSSVAWTYSTSGDANNTQNIEAKPLNGIYLFDGTGEFETNDPLYINNSSYSTSKYLMCKTKTGGPTVYFANNTTHYIAIKNNSSVASTYKLLKFS